MAVSIDVLIGAAVVFVLVVLVALYAFHRYMTRRGPELAAREAKSVVKDRAFNQIRIGHAAADRLAQTGVDVSGAQELLNRAEAVRAGGNFEMSIDLSKRAQDLLAKARTGAPAPAAFGPDRPRTPMEGAALTSDPRSTPSTTAFADGAGARFVAGGEEAGPENVAATTTAQNRPPKNKLEARFQLSLAQDELAKAQGTTPPPKGAGEAVGLLSDAQAAYDRQDFTEALRLALKGRRTIGARVETLPVTPVAAARPFPANAGAATATSDASGTTRDTPTFNQRCQQCGRVVSVADQFCRGCGTPIAPAPCHRCGAPLLAGDRFCGNCGTTQS
ncbi:MAG TPA: zinc ribbon domain-containing protein [Thermoplasmata archaeon]|nr:zinc ribbon domain-containing protein [Thermoplasmata archaeon]